MLKGAQYRIATLVLTNRVSGVPVASTQLKVWRRLTDRLVRAVHKVPRSCRDPGASGRVEEANAHGRVFLNVTGKRKGAGMSTCSDDAGQGVVDFSLHVRMAHLANESHLRGEIRGRDE
jgi:hypothetical protein